MRINPDVLEDGRALGNMVAAEDIVCIEGVRKVDGGHWAPAKNLLAFSSCTNSLKNRGPTSKKHAFKYGNLSRSCARGGLPASQTSSTSACARFKILG